jgi:DNA-binding CsgD family transcriptional regulator
MTEPLTARELQTLRLLAQGHTYARIAQKLGISEHTVTTHIRNIYRKLEVGSAANAVSRGFELGLLEAPLSRPS